MGDLLLWQFASWMVRNWYEWAVTPGLELLAHSDWICLQWGKRCGGEKIGGVCAPRGWAAHLPIGYTYDVIACALCDWAELLWVWPKQHSGSEIRWNNGHYYACFTGVSLRDEGCALKKKKGRAGFAVHCQRQRTTVTEYAFECTVGKIELNTAVKEAIRITAWSITKRE